MGAKRPSPSIAVRIGEALDNGTLTTVASIDGRYRRVQAPWNPTARAKVGQVPPGLAPRKGRGKKAKTSHPRLHLHNQSLVTTTIRLFLQSEAPLLPHLLSIPLHCSYQDGPGKQPGDPGLAAPHPQKPQSHCPDPCPTVWTPFRRESYREVPRRCCIHVCSPYLGPLGSGLDESTGCEPVLDGMMGIGRMEWIGSNASRPGLANSSHRLSAKALLLPLQLTSLIEVGRRRRRRPLLPTIDSRAPICSRLAVGAYEPPLSSLVAPLEQYQYRHRPASTYIDLPSLYRHPCSILASRASSTPMGP